MCISVSAAHGRSVPVTRCTWQTHGWPLDRGQSGPLQLRQMAATGVWPSTPLLCRCGVESPLKKLGRVWPPAALRRTSALRGSCWVPLHQPAASWAARGTLGGRTEGLGDVRWTGDRSGRSLLTAPPPPDRGKRWRCQCGHGRRMARFILTGDVLVGYSHFSPANPTHDGSSRMPTSVTYLVKISGQRIEPWLTLILIFLDWQMVIHYIGIESSIN